MKKLLVAFMLAGLASAALQAETGDFVATVSAGDAGQFNLPVTSGAQSYVIVVPLEMEIAQDQTLFKPVFDPVAGRVFFKNATGAQVNGQHGAVRQDAFDCLVANIDQTWQAFYYDSQGHLVSKALAAFSESQFQDQVALTSGSLQLKRLPEIAIDSSAVAWGLFSGSIDASAGVPSKGVDWAQTNGSWYLLNSRTGAGLRIRPESTWRFEKQAIAWWNSANPGAPTTLAEVRAALLSEDVKNVPSDPSQTAANFSAAAYAQAFSGFRTDLFQELVALNTSTGPDQSNFITDFHNYLPLVLQTDVTSPSKGWGFLDSSLYLAPQAGAYGYEYLFQQFLNSQHFTQKIDTLKYDLDGVSSSQLATKALHYLVGVEDFLRNPVSVSSLNTVEFAYWSAVQSQFSKLPGVDASQDPLDGITLTASLATGKADLLGTAAELEFVSAPAPALGPFDAVFIPSSGNLISPKNVVNFDDLAGLVNTFAPVGRSGSISVQFGSPVDIGSIALWCDSGVSISQLQYRDSQGQLRSMDVSTLETSATVLSSADGSKELSTGSSAGRPFPLKIWNFAGKLSVASLTVTLTGGSVFGLRAYTVAQSVFPYSWTTTNGVVRIRSASPVPLRAIECFPATSTDLAPYFVRTGFGRRPALSFQINELSNFASSIRYSAGGLESTLGYNLKVKNNRLWKGASGSGLSFSELDLAHNAIDSQLLYKTAVSLTAPSPAPSTFYPFSYGLNVPNGAGAVLQANSPYFLEKIAGVDSAGLLESLLMTVKGGTASIASQTEGFLTDSLFLSRWQFRLSFPSFTQSSPPIAWPRTDYSSTPIAVDSLWFINNTRVVLNPSEVRPGDLLVGFEGSEVSVAVVVATPPAPTVFASKLDLWNWMKGVRVVAINRYLQQAYETTWSNLSLNPGQYHIRRIVLPSTGSQVLIPVELVPLPGGRPIWTQRRLYPHFRVVADDVGVVASSLSYVFSQASEPNDKGWVNWIPNTGELHYLGRIGLHPTQSLEPNPAWSISSVTDPGFKHGDTNGNVHNNTYPNPTTFDLVALGNAYSENGIPVLGDHVGLNQEVFDSSEFQYIAQFQYSGDGTYSIHGPIMAPVAYGFNFIVEDNFLVAIKKSTKARFSKFAIVAINPHPGDNIKIQFGIGENTTSLATAPRLAVYDKKLLWRANLYIDDGEQDWNNLHPWNAPLSGQGLIRDPLSGQTRDVSTWWQAEWGYNDWNRIYGGSEVYDGSISGMSSLLVGDGRQVVSFPRWTKYNEGNFVAMNPDGSKTRKDDPLFTTVRGAVAYTNNETDSPFRFVWELGKQQDALKDLKQFKATTAPGNDWNGYVGHPASESSLAIVTTFQSNGLDWTGYEPYRPNYSAVLKYDKGFDINWYPGSSQSSGLDCGALIFVAWNYDHNPYFNSVHYGPNYGTNWNMPNPGSFGPKELDSSAQSWLIFDKSVQGDLAEFDGGEAPVPFSIVPGDVVVLIDSTGPTHSAIVQSVGLGSAQGQVRYKDVIFIEAASEANREYRVLNRYSLWDAIKSKWYVTLHFRRLAAK